MYITCYTSLKPEKSLVPGSTTAELLIPDKVQAPRRILEEVKSEAFYHAVLVKRFGKITPSEFIDLSRRFVLLCDQVYHGTSGILKVDEMIPVTSTENFSASIGSWPENSGTKIDLLLSQDEIEKILREHETATLTLKPALKSTELNNSFAKIEWTKKLPSKLAFYAQSKPLMSYLYKKMFFVPGSAPNINMKVRLGISAYLEEFAS